MGAKGTPVYLTDKNGNNELDITANGEIQVVGSITPSGTQDVNLLQVAGAAVALGQALEAASLPVVLASDQPSLDVKLQDGAGTALTADDWLARGTNQSLDVNVRSGPNVTTIITLVQPGDIGANYVAGSEGQPKTIKEYPTGAAGASPAKLTTLKYEDTEGPTQATSIAETATTV